MTECLKILQSSNEVTVKVLCKTSCWLLYNGRDSVLLICMLLISQQYLVFRTLFYRHWLNDWIGRKEANNKHFMLSKK